MSLQSEVLTLLAAQSSITDLVGSRLSKEWPEQNTVLPAISLTRVSGGKDSALDMSNHFSRARIQIDCFASTHEGATTLADIVKDYLHGYKGAAGSFQIETMSNDNEIDLGENEGDRNDRRVSLDFLIIYL